MPPVFGPGVAVADALEVLGRRQRHDPRAVGQAQERHLGAGEALLDHDDARRRRAWPARRRPPRPASSVTSTPLPAASPSVLTTYGPGSVLAGSRGPRAPRRGGTSRGRRWARRRRRARSFIHAFEPSSAAPSAPGPNTRRPCGPQPVGQPVDQRRLGTDDEQVGVDLARRRRRRTTGCPGCPGVTTTSAVRASTSASACSRPPGPDDADPHHDSCTNWSRPGPMPTKRIGHADLLLEEGEVLRGLLRAGRRPRGTPVRSVCQPGSSS